MQARTDDSSCAYGLCRLFFPQAPALQAASVDALKTDEKSNASTGAGTSQGKQDDPALEPEIWQEVPSVVPEAEAIRKMEAELAAIMAAFDTEYQDKLEEEESALPEPQVSSASYGHDPALHSCLRVRSCEFRVQFHSASAAIDVDDHIEEVPTFKISKGSVCEVGEVSGLLGNSLTPIPRSIVEFKVKSIKDLSVWLDDRSRLFDERSSSKGDRKSRRQVEKQAGDDEVDIALAHALENAVFNVKDVL